MQGEPVGILKRIFWDRILNRPLAKKQEHPAELAMIARCRHGLETDSCSLCLGRTRERDPGRAERRNEELRSFVRMVSDKLYDLSGWVNSQVEQIDAEADIEEQNSRFLRPLSRVDLQLSFLHRELDEMRKKQDEEHN